MRFVVPTALAGVFVACAGNVSVGFIHDAGAVDAGALDAPQAVDTGVSFGDSAYPDAGPPASKFFILVTETPAGSPQPSQWSGILRYDVPDDFMAATQSTAIAAADVADPVGLAFRATTAEVFVGNRRGNTTGSISRFLYYAATESFVKNGPELMMNDSAGGVVQIAFSPDDLELFVARDGNEITRFKFDSSGNMTSNGSIPNLGTMIGVAVSPDGTRLYATEQFSATIREFALPSGTEISGGFTISGATRPHLMVMDPVSSHLYVSDVQSDEIYDLALDGSNDLTVAQTIAATNPISVALSPDRTELFSTSHNGNPPDVIERFKVDGAIDSGASQWVSEGPSATINTTTALGGTLVFLASSIPIFH